MRFLNLVREKRFALAHLLGGAPVYPRRFIRRVERQGAIKTLHRLGPPAKTGISQGQVPEGLDVVGVLAQNALEKLDGFLEVPLVQTHKSVIKELGVGHIRVQTSEGRVAGLQRFRAYGAGAEGKCVKC